MENRKVIEIKNLHPIYHITRHPLWPEALQKLHVRDYDDFPNFVHPSMKKKPSHVTDETNFISYQPVTSALYDGIKCPKKPGPKVQVL